MFKREVPADPFLGIFMACGKEKEREKYGKSKVLPSGVWGHQNNRQSTPLMKSIMILMGCGLVVKLRRGEWNGLIGHPKDRGKDRPNSRTKLTQGVINGPISPSAATFLFSPKFFLSFCFFNS
jgi:hypothetical protein